MTKTAKHDEEKPKPPMTDAQVVAAFIAEADEIDREAALFNDPNSSQVYRGAAEARRELGRRLAEVREERRQYVKDATERVAEAFNNAGRTLADFLNNAYDKAEKRADQDRQA
jgi:tRNA uridine 5-carbamoylmethylation protein Kti12